MLGILSRVKSAVFGFFKTERGFIFLVVFKVSNMDPLKHFPRISRATNVDFFHKFFSRSISFFIIFKGQP